MLEDKDKEDQRELKLLGTKSLQMGKCDMIWIEHILPHKFVIFFGQS